MALAPVVPINSTSRRIVGYKIISDTISHDMSKMERNVMIWLDRGYRLHGEPISMGTYTIVQVLVKYEE